MSIAVQERPKSSFTTSLLPLNPSFAGHQTFAIRSGWLKKGIDALQNQDAGGSKVFARDDALVTLGVGKNMVQSIRHWVLATRLAEEHLTTGGREIHPTMLGKALFGSPTQDGWDPFLEDDATLWLLHWRLAGPESLAFSWIWVFNFFREYEFSRETLAASIQAGAGARIAKVPSKETVLRDVECLVHTYAAGLAVQAVEETIDCPLRDLGLIRATFDRSYRFDIGSKPTLPPFIFYYALVCFWVWKYERSAALSVWDITYEEGSPGVVFKLDEDTVLDYLDGISDATTGLLRFDDTALGSSVIWDRSDFLEPLTLLEKHYRA